MEHDELIGQGITDILDGNESYAARYMQGQLFAHDVIGLNHLTGNEGFLDAVWEKIKQFCAWLASLFTSKKETGKATKEVGLKTSLPKPTREVIKVTPVPAKELTLLLPAPKAHAPTPEQKKADKVRIRVQLPPQSSSSSAKEPEKTEEKEVELIEVPHNMKRLFGSLMAVATDVQGSLKRFNGSYVILNGMKNAFGDKLQPKHWMGIHIIDPAEVLRASGHVLDTLKKFNVTERDMESMTRDKVLHLATTDITNTCRAIVDLIDKVRILTSMTASTDKVESKDFLYKGFEKQISEVPEDQQKAFASVLFRCGKLDFDAYSLNDLSDAFSRVKQEVFDGKYFVRAPKS